MDLQIANVGNNSVLLTWEANSEPDLGGYEVYRKVNNGSINKISGSNLVTTNSYDICGVVVSNNGYDEHSYYVKAVDTSNKKSTLSIPVTVEVQYVNCTTEKIAIGNPAEDGLIEQYFLEANYPNPFNPTTTIAFALPEDAAVRLTVFDVNGKQITELLNEQLPAGRYEIPFDASELSSGVYLYRLAAGNNSKGSGQGFIQTRKMMLIK